MRLCIFIIFYFGVNVLSAQSYFNERYASDIGWGSIVNSIALSNDSLFFNVFNVNDTTGSYQVTFSKLDVSDGIISSPFNIVNDSIDYHFAKLTPCLDGGFADVMSLDRYGKQVKFGVIKYKENGDTAFFNVSPDSFLFIYIYDIKETTDQGFILSGTLQLIPGNQGGTEDLILIKTDSLGNEQWRKIYGLTDRREQGHSVALCTDGGYIISGVKGKKAYVLKTDSLGNKEWDKTYGHPSWVNKPAYSIIQTQDGGFAFVGAIATEHFTGADNVLPWVVKLNSVGDTLWTNINYGISESPYDNNFKDIIELINGELVICGQQRVENLDTINYSGPQRTKGVIAKYNKNGNKKWIRYYNHPELVEGISSEHILNSIVQTSDGGFAAAGWLFPDPPDTGTQDTWVIKVDSFGCLVPGCEVVSVPKIQSAIVELRVYPNPANNYITIESANYEAKNSIRVEISNSVGQMVIRESYISQGSHNVDLSTLSTGIYLLQILDGKEVIQKQLIEVVR